MTSFTHTCTRTCTRTWCWRVDEAGWGGNVHPHLYTSNLHTHGNGEGTRLLVTLGHDYAMSSAAQNMRSVSSRACSEISEEYMRFCGVHILTPDSAENCESIGISQNGHQHLKGFRKVNNARLVGAVLQNMLINGYNCRCSWTSNTWTILEPTDQNNNISIDQFLQHVCCDFKTNLDEPENEVTIRPAFHIFIMAYGGEKPHLHHRMQVRRREK